MEAQLIPKGIKISRKLRSDPSVWLLDRSHRLLLSLSQKHKHETDRYDQLEGFHIFVKSRENVEREQKRAHNDVVLNVKILIKSE